MLASGSTIVCNFARELFFCLSRHDCYGFNGLRFYLDVGAVFPLGIEELLGLLGDGLSGFNA